MLRFLGLALLCFFVVGLSSAQIQESREWLVGRDQQDIVSFINKFGFLSDKKIPVGSVAIVADAGGAFLNVTVLGPPSANARAMAETLSAGLDRKRLVQYSQENDYAAAQSCQSSARIGQTRSSEILALEPIRKRFEAAGSGVLIGLRTTDFCTVAPSNLVQSYQTRKGIYYLFTGPKPIPNITVSSQLQPWCLIVLFLVFVAPPLVVCLGLMLAVALAKDVRVDKQVRLERFKKIAMTGIVLPFAVATVFSLWAISSHQMLPLCDLWFGSRLSTALLPFAMLPLPIMLPCALWVGRFEAKLRSNEDVDSTDFRHSKK